ncbi:hypothetical protein ACHAW5_011057 [Stephanodiscus triporus]|uniref:Uncharacterized protein n=1 Tax=Stephanodiscus triporus TaxID=2934178 RepID=A0ABD3QPB8_9STRA
MFPFVGDANGGPRLWIINKNALYDSKSLIVSTLPRDAIDQKYCSLMPSKVYGKGGIPLPSDHQGESSSSIGTFLVGYDGLSDNGDEFLQVTTLYDVLASPLTTPTIQFVNLGNIEENSFVELPDAKQAGGTAAIDVNDRRVLDAVWRDGSLWVTFEIRDISIAQGGITKGYYVQLNTTSKDLSIISQGTISGRNIDPLDMNGDEVSTFFPAVDVNSDGYAMFSFSASSPKMFAGAFISGTNASSIQCIKEGEGYYLRTFGGPRNRWGDYLGISVDPSNEKFFWAFSQYAKAPNASLAEGGLWGTVWARTSGTQGSASKPPQQKKIFG